MGSHHSKSGGSRSSRSLNLNGSLRVARLNGGKKQVLLANHSLLQQQQQQQQSSSSSQPTWHHHLASSGNFTPLGANGTSHLSGGGAYGGLGGLAGALGYAAHGGASCLGGGGGSGAPGNGNGNCRTSSSCCSDSCSSCLSLLEGPLDYMASGGSSVSQGAANATATCHCVSCLHGRQWNATAKPPPAPSAKTTRHQASNKRTRRQVAASKSRSHHNHHHQQQQQPAPKATYILNHQLSYPLNHFAKSQASNLATSTMTTTTTTSSSQQVQSVASLGLPATRQSLQLQMRGVLEFIDSCKEELTKYVYLRHLKDFNEQLFYHTLTQNVEQLMPLVYTPTVGLACQRFSSVYMLNQPRGLFININDSGRVRQILQSWPERDVRVIVVTDGERILGLGDLGANGMGISIGKLSLYTALAGIPPKNVLPICLDVGTQNQGNLRDPFYIGLKQERTRGAKYDQLLEEFMESVVDTWGRSCLIQFEDFANATAFSLLQRYRDRYCTFNDDIQGTASVCLAGLISAARKVNKKLSTLSYLFYGAGEANLGTANLLMMAMTEADGLSREEAKDRIWLVDSKGLVVASREDLNGHKRAFARSSDTPHLSGLEDIIRHTKPAAIIGASAQAGAFNESICKLMLEFNEKPIIFALSNPTSKAECTASQAYEWTEGKCVFASGSPFDPVEYNGKTYITGQGNNAYIFPGVGLAAIAAHTHAIPEEVFLVAARALSDQLEPSDMELGLVYPRLTKIRDCTLKIATRVLEFFYSERLATYRPEPNDKTEFLRSIQYDPTIAC